MPCVVEILSIGNELLLGNTVNTNASWLATQITSLGGRVTRITTVPDKLQDISEALNEAIRRKPNFIITTGGIGPTFDDMTIKAVARALHLRLRLDRTATRMIREHYVRRFPGRKISLTRPRLKMAMIPSGGTAIQNPVGTAPAVHLRVRGTHVFCLPGVPKEAKAIFSRSLSEMIRAAAGHTVFAEKWLRVQGVMESSLAPVIDRVMSEWRGIYIKSHPRGMEAGGRPCIELHFSTSAPNSPRAEQSLLGAMGDIIRQLADFKAKISQVS
jgi:nicotinamide-nucleotide amidase